MKLVTEIDRDARADVRRLPLTLASVEEEPFASYVDRLAEDLQVTPAVVLDATGISRGYAPSRPPTGYGVSLSPRQLSTFAFATALSAERVGEMLLTTLVGTAFDTSLACDHEAIARSLRRQWVYLAASHFCPLCLRERSGAWRLRWKLPWSFACVRHQNLLVAVCPGCGRRTGGGRSDRGTAPAGLARVPSLGDCSNPIAVGREGRKATVCGAALCEAPTIALEPGSRLISAQLRIDAALQGTQMQLAGEAVSSVEYFAALRGLCALVLHAAHESDLGDLPPVAETAFRGHYERRSATDSERTRLRRQGRDGRAGPKTRCYSRVPDEPALMAAIAPLATEILSASSVDALQEAIAPLAARARERNAYYVRRLSGDFGFSPALRRAFEGRLACSGR